MRTLHLRWNCDLQPLAEFTLHGGTTSPICSSTSTRSLFYDLLKQKTSALYSKIFKNSAPALWGVLFCRIRFYLLHYHADSSRSNIPRNIIGFCPNCIGDVA